MFNAGAAIADQFPGDLDDDQIQPNGVDLRLGSIYEQREPGEIREGSKHVGTRQEIDSDDDDMYLLEPGTYIVEYADTISIPDDSIGFVYPRSSLIRNSAMLHTAVWDAGYTGKGEGLLVVHKAIALEQGARIGQIALADADTSGSYDGDYQNENIGN